jgi:hypothetical protein
MANAEAWSEGWQLGKERSQEHRAHKQAMSDAQFQEKHNEIQGMIDNLQTKLPTIDANSPEYLQTKDQLAQALQARNEHWHPSKNPGALEKFGRMLGRDLHFPQKTTDTPVAPPVYGQPTMEIDGEKVPTGPAYKVQGPQTPAQTKAATEANQLVAAGPLSPEQQATGKAKAEAAGNLVTFQSNLKLYDSQHPHAATPDATPEEKEARDTYINELLQGATGIKEPKEVAEVWTTPKGAVPEEYPKGSGKYRLLKENKAGNQHYVQMPEGYSPSEAKPKQGTSALSVGLDSYAKSHGFASFNDIPNESRDAVMNYEIRKQALDKAMPQSTTTTTLKQDINGQWVPVTETNYRTPGGNITLADPLGASKSSPKSSPSGEESLASTPKKAQPAPKNGTPPSPSSAKSPSTPTRSGNTRVGAPLFQGRTPAIAKAQNDVVDATKLYSIAKQVEAKPNDAFNQKRLAVQLERASAGRFTVQALDYVKQMGWGATLQEWANKPTTGALSPQLVRQLIDGAHENLKAAQESLKAAVNMGGTSPNAGGASPNVGNMTDDEFLMKVGK